MDYKFEVGDIVVCDATTLSDGSKAPEFKGEVSSKGKGSINSYPWVDVDVDEEFRSDLEKANLPNYDKVNHRIRVGHIFLRLNEPKTKREFNRFKIGDRVLHKETILFDGSSIPNFKGAIKEVEGEKDLYIVSVDEEFWGILKEDGNLNYNEERHIYVIRGYLLESDSKEDSKIKKPNLTCKACSDDKQKFEEQLSKVKEITATQKTAPPLESFGDSDSEDENESEFPEVRKVLAGETSIAPSSSDISINLKLNLVEGKTVSLSCFDGNFNINIKDNFNG